MNYVYQPLYKPAYQPVMGKCVLGVQAGPQTVIIRQVIGENETQKVIDVCVRVPRQKPAIEQIIDVFVKKLRITRVEVIPNKVIVCGDFEIKAIYVACLPDQPVHAVEVKRVRFTADVPIWGARPGMDAEARAAVEYVDYDCDSKTRAHWHKHNQGYDAICNEDYEQGCHHPKPKKSEPCCCPPPETGCTRHFNVSVVLKIIAKVMADREVIIYPGAFPGMPIKPKG